MAVPDFQSLMRPVLEAARYQEAKISDVIESLSNRFELTDEDRKELIPSGTQTRMANRVHWAKSYLKQAGLVRATGRGRFIATEKGLSALADESVVINRVYLEQFDEFRDFKDRSSSGSSTVVRAPEPSLKLDQTPYEILKEYYQKIDNELARELLSSIRNSEFSVLERVVVDLLVAMGYGGAFESAGSILGRSGDSGVDGVIDQDQLGVDQIYVQAKRYKEGSPVGAGAIRDFFGALSLKNASKGIFVTSSRFTSEAIATANSLASRIVLIDGEELVRLMIKFNIGCSEREKLVLRELNEEYFSDSG